MFFGYPRNILSVSESYQAEGDAKEHAHAHEKQAPSRAPAAGWLLDCCALLDGDLLICVLL